MEAKKFRIRKINVSEYGSSNSRTFDLDFKSIEDCRKVISMAGLVDWEIVEKDDHWNDEVVEASDHYKEWLKIQKEEHDKDEVKKLARVEKINALPKRFEISYSLPKGLDIWIKRGKAEYNPRHPPRLRLI